LSIGRSALLFRELIAAPARDCEKEVKKELRTDASVRRTEPLAELSMPALTKLFDLPIREVQCNGTSSRASDRRA